MDLDGGHAAAGAMSIKSAGPEEEMELADGGLDMWCQVPQMWQGYAPTDTLPAPPPAPPMLREPVVTYPPPVAPTVSSPSGALSVEQSEPPLEASEVGRVA